MTSIVAKLNKVLSSQKKTKHVYNPTYINNKPKDIRNKVKNELSNSSGL